VKTTQDKKFEKCWHTRMNHCLQCKHKLDAATSVGHNNGPSPGSVSICVSCGAIAIFAEDGSLREATVDERFEIIEIPEVKKAIALIRWLPKKKP
jgi:hypothetical protein